MNIDLTLIFCGVAAAVIVYQQILINRMDDDIEDIIDQTEELIDSHNTLVEALTDMFNSVAADEGGAIH